MSELRGKSGRVYRDDELLYPEELADAVRRGRVYVFAMRKAGFPMPGGHATVAEYREWHRQNPNFTTASYNGRKSKNEPTEGPRVTSLAADFS